MDEHYAGDDTNVRLLARGILAAYAGISVEDFEKSADHFLRSAQHPTLGRSYLECAYTPMVELLDYLTANGFTTYIASGGGRDFMRPVSQDMYGIPRERVIGSSSTFAYTSNDHGGTITHKPEADYLDDGPEKPVRIWNRTGRRPLLAAGNSNGDVADARVHPPPRQADLAPPDPARRRRARVRLHHRRRAGTRAEPRPTAGPSSASRTTGPPSFRPETPSTPRAAWSAEDCVDVKSFGGDVFGDVVEAGVVAVGVGQRHAARARGPIFEAAVSVC